MKRVGVTGASGFIGRAVVAALRRRGDFVRAFVRSVIITPSPEGDQVRQLDLIHAPTARETALALEGLDAVVHLSGESVSGRWTAQKKKKIHDSRQLTTRNLVAGLQACARRPALICASATGYYGSRGDEPLTERSAPGDGFLAKVCIDWELEAHKAAEFGTRVVCVRQAPVMGRDGGALAAMLTPFRFGAGGPLGSGRQWWPWIHLDDDVALVLFAIDRDDLSGAINAVSPDVATNARFARALGHALRRPSLAYAPAPALRLVLGEFADALLASQLVLPARAIDLGFEWKHACLEQALLELLDPGGDRAPATSRFAMTQKVTAPPQRVFDFLANPENLASLTPPAMRFRMIAPRLVEMRRGAIAECEFVVWGRRVRWKILVTRWQPAKAFEDLQLRGPYLLWRHRHEFLLEDDGVIVRDTIDYELPFAPLSNVLLPAVRKELATLFAYRRDQIGRVLGLAPPEIK